MLGQKRDEEDPIAAKMYLLNKIKSNMGKPGTRNSSRAGNRTQASTANKD